ncbi:response regulator [bacterium]|nr:response regulator [bacterium]
MADKPDFQPSLEPALSTTTVAKYCRVSGVQVNRWIKDGKLKGYRYPGGRYKVSKKNFREFLELNNIPVIEKFFEENTPVKIMIGEDDVDFAQSIVQALEDEFPDYEVRAANDGYEVLLCMGSYIPDILLLDMKMPKINGLEVCQRVKSTDSLEGVKIVAMTGNSVTYTREVVLQNGADDYLIKPFERAELFRVIGKLLSRKAAV